MVVPTAEEGATMEVEDEFSFGHAEFGVPLWYLGPTAWQGVGYLDLTFMEEVWAVDHWFGSWNREDGGGLPREEWEELWA